MLQWMGNGKREENKNWKAKIGSSFAMRVFRR
jgi:hypothetical protein